MIMPKRREFTKEQIIEIQDVRKKNKDKNIDNRLKALLLHADGMKHEKIAEQTEFVKTYISELVGKYCKRGIKAITESNYGGNNRNMSIEQEKALLEPFMKAAQAGQIVEVSAIKKAYEKAIGRSLNNEHGQIYYVLKRHGWRKIMPRSKHPKKASEEEINSSKKLNPK